MSLVKDQALVSAIVAQQRWPVTALPGIVTAAVRQDERDTHSEGCAHGK